MAARRRSKGWRILSVVFFSVALGLVPLGTVSAHLSGDGTLCISQLLYGGDPSCKAHWENSQMTYKWGALIATSAHTGHRTSFVRGADSWQNATSPIVPWYETYSSSSSTVVNIVDSGTSGVLGKATIAQPGTGFHIPRMLEIYAKHDIENLFCETTWCSWYVGTSTSVSLDQIDEWSVWIHEIGHAQNIAHQSVDTHLGPDQSPTGHDHTMRANTFNGNTDKRNSTYGLRQHEKVHACKPYELSHNDITCGSL